MTIGKIEACDLAPLCDPLLYDPSPFARIAAIYAQSACDDNQNTAQLAEFLLNHDSIRVRAQAAYVLGELGNPSSGALLRHAAARGTGRQRTRSSVCFSSRSPRRSPSLATRASGTSWLRLYLSRGRRISRPRRWRRRYWVRSRAGSPCRSFKT